MKNEESAFLVLACILSKKYKTICDEKQKKKKN
jgi:hypothetical protein